MSTLPAWRRHPRRSAGTSRVACVSGRHPRRGASSTTLSGLADRIEDPDMDKPKRQLREEKREIKQAGNKRRRQHLKRELAENPEEAPYTEVDFGRYRSAELNGMDRDAKRRGQHRAESE